jgi:hypothetical protein
MNTAKLDGAPRVTDQRLKILPALSASPRCPEWLVVCAKDEFHGQGVNRIDSCVFLLNKKGIFPDNDSRRCIF